MIGMVDSSAPKQFGELEMKKGEAKKGRSAKGDSPAPAEDVTNSSSADEEALSSPPANIRWLGLHLDIKG